MIPEASHDAEIADYQKNRINPKRCVVQDIEHGKPWNQNFILTVGEKKSRRRRAATESKLPTTDHSHKSAKSGKVVGKGLAQD
jgi:hypothetical protein